MREAIENLFAGLQMQQLITHHAVLHVKKRVGNDLFLYLDRFVVVEAG